MLNNKLIIPLLISLGVVVTFLKDVVIAYYFGTSEKLDIFRTASYLPYSFFQTLGTVFVGLYLPRVMNNRSNSELITAQLTKVSIVITLLGVILAPFYTPLLAPNFSENNKEKLIIATVLCWVGFFFYSFYFHYRIKLQAYERNSLVASTSLINSLIFILIMLVIHHLGRAGGVYEIEIVFAITAVLFMSAYIVLGRNTLEFKSILVNIFRTPNISPVPFNLLLIVIVVHITTVAPRVIDRAFLSRSPQGYISALDYSFSILTAILLVVGTSVSIIYATSIAREINSKGRRNKTKFAILVTCVISTIIAILIYAFASSLVNGVFVRGEFSTESSIVTTRFLTATLPALPLMAVNMILLQVLLGTQSSHEILAPNILRLSIKMISIYFIASYFEVANYPLTIGLSLLLGEIAFFLGAVSIVVNMRR